MAGGNGALLPPNYAPLPILRKILPSLGIKLATPTTWALVAGKYQIILLALCTFVVVGLPNSYEWTMARINKDSFAPWGAIAIGTLLAAALCSLTRVSEFLYFQF